MTANDLLYWMQQDAKAPLLAEERIEWMLARVCAVVASSAGARGACVADYLPPWWEKRKDADRPKTNAELSAKVAAVFDQF